METRRVGAQLPCSSISICFRPSLILYLIKEAGSFKTQLKQHPQHFMYLMQVCSWLLVHIKMMIRVTLRR